MSKSNQFFTFKMNNNNRLDKRVTIRRPKQIQLEKQNTLSLSDEELIEQNVTEEEARNEEIRLTEEAMANNVKMIKKQKARFLRLQKILSRNAILIPMCALFSVLSAATILSSSLTDYYETITYDINKLKKNVEIENNFTINQFNTYLISNNKTELIKNKKFFYALNESSRVKRNLKWLKKLYDDNILGGILINDETENSNHIEYHSTLIEQLPPQFKNAFYYEIFEHTDYIMLKRSNIFVNTSSSVKKNPIFTTHSGLVRQCNYLSEDSKRILNIETCSYYKMKNISEHHHEIYGKDPSRDVVRWHNAALCCIIVSYILLICSWTTGTVAIFTKKVPITLATAVLKLCICVFLIFLLGIVHRKIYSEEKQHDCSDLRIDLTIVCSARKITYGYSLGLAWLAAFFTVLCCICWFQITKMQKLLFTNGYC